MKIQKVAVLGAGAVGSYIIWGLSQKEDIELGVVAEGERAERLKKGCVINQVTYDPNVWSLEEAKGADLLVVALKYGALSGAMETIRRITEENTTVMSLQDLDAGRHTEIDMFSGALMRMGRELGIPVPYNEFTYHMIKALEEKNDGKFDYDGIKGMTTCAR